MWIKPEGRRDRMAPSDVVSVLPPLSTSSPHFGPLRSGHGLGGELLSLTNTVEL